LKYLNLKKNSAYSKGSDSEKKKYRNDYSNKAGFNPNKNFKSLNKK